MQIERLKIALIVSLCSQEVGQLLLTVVIQFCLSGEIEEGVNGAKIKWENIQKYRI